VNQVENVRKFVPDDEEQKIDLYTYWKIFWRKKFYLFIPLLLSLVIAFLGVRELTPVYESSTLVSAEEQNILAGMSRYVTPVDDRRQDQSRRFQAMIETRVMSREFLEMVIMDLGLQKSYKLKTQPTGNGELAGLSQEELTMRSLVEILRKKISVRTTLPGFYSISVQDSDPGTAHVLAYKISDKYIEVTQQAKLQGLRQAGAFSDEQLAIYKEKLEDSERELDRVRRELATRGADTNPINANNIHVAEARVNSLDAQVGRNEMGLRRVRERLTSVFGMIPSTDRVTDDETLNNLERQILADTEERILQELSGNEQAVEDLTSYEALWEELRNRVAEIVHDEYGEFSNDYKPLITEYFFQRRQTNFYRSIERRLNSYIEQYKDNISRRPQLEREAGKLAHEVETNQAIYDAFLESKTSAQINEAMQSTNLGVRISVIEKAERPISPVKPDQLKVIVIAAMFGLICGLGAILVTEYMDDSFRTVDEVQRVLKIPVLGTIPKTVSHFAWEKKRRGRMIMLWTAGLILFIAMISGAMFIYAKALQESSIGVELSEDLLGR
jgi:succinoglycan biosynthesis transport protein ExoP